MSIKVFSFDKLNSNSGFIKDVISSVVISKDNKFLVSSSWDKSIKVFDFDTKHEIYHFKDAHDGLFFPSFANNLLIDRIHSITISHDSRFIVSASADKMIKIFDIFTEEEIDRFSNLRSGTITSLAISSDDRYIIYGCENRSIKIVDYKTKQQVHIIKKAHKGIFFFEVSLPKL